jgi:hypothetical protein
MRRFGTSVLAALMLVALVGCSTKDAETVSARDTITNDSEASDATTASRSIDDDVTANGRGESTDLPDLADLDQCLEASMAFFALLALPLSFMTGVSDEDLAELEENLGELEGSVPADVQDDYDTLAEAYREFAEAMQGVGRNVFDPGYADQIEAAGERLDAPAVVEAQDRISEYFDEICG